MADTRKDVWAELRKPFPKEVIGQLPKGGVKLDFVGHAAVTDRLLSVDPEWTWEPLALTEQGLPAYDQQGGLWIRLTINGVTRLGYGDGPNPKERIGDAIRNAAMRFGVALDLWSKDELESTLEDPSLKNHKPSQERPSGAPQKPHTAPQTGDNVISEAQGKLLLAKARDASGLSDWGDIKQWFLDRYGIEVKDVLKPDMNEILNDLMGTGDE